MSHLSNLTIYLAGAAAVTAGIGFALDSLGVSNEWIGIGALVIMGVALMGGVQSTRRPETPDP